MSGPVVMQHDALVHRVLIVLFYGKVSSVMCFWYISKRKLQIKWDYQLRQVRLFAHKKARTTAPWYTITVKRWHSLCALQRGLCAWR